MSSRIQTAFPSDSPMPENIFPDMMWLSQNRAELYKKYGSCVVVIYQKEIIGMGKNRQEALANAEANLAEDIELIPAIVEYVSNPYRVGQFQRREVKE